MGVDIDGSEAPEPTINWLHFQILLGFFLPSVFCGAVEGVHANQDVRVCGHFVMCLCVFSKVRESPEKAPL